MPAPQVKKPAPLNPPDVKNVSPEVVKSDVPLEKPLEVSSSSPPPVVPSIKNKETYIGSRPCDWGVLSRDADGIIHRRNNITREEFIGTNKEFNAMLRG